MSEYLIFHQLCKGKQILSKSNRIQLPHDWVWMDVRKRSEITCTIRIQSPQLNGLIRFQIAVHVDPSQDTKWNKNKGCGGANAVTQSYSNPDTNKPASHSLHFPFSNYLQFTIIFKKKAIYMSETNVINSATYSTRWRSSKLTKQNDRCVASLT